MSIPGERGRKRERNGGGSEGRGRKGGREGEEEEMGMEGEEEGMREGGRGREGGVERYDLHITSRFTSSCAKVSRSIPVSSLNVTSPC